MNPRKCFVCSAPVAECMGLVLARDLLPYLFEQTQLQGRVREMCGKCGLNFVDMLEDEFEELIAQHP